MKISKDLIITGGIALLVAGLSSSKPKGAGGSESGLPPLVLKPVVIVKDTTATQTEINLMKSAGMTDFQIANRVGDVSPGQTLILNGKEFINTGNGYANLTPEYTSGISYAESLPRATLEQRLVDTGFATRAQLSAMTDVELDVYAGAVKANGGAI